MINHHSNKRLTQDEVNKKANMWSGIISENPDTFILPEDPLYKYHPVFLPYRKCQCCDHEYDEIASINSQQTMMEYDELSVD